MLFQKVLFLVLASSVTAGILPQIPNPFLQLFEGNTRSMPRQGTIAGYVTDALFPVLKSLVSRSPELKLVSRVRLEPEIRKDAVRYKLRYGPIPIIAANASRPWTISPSVDTDGQSFMRVLQHRSICGEDCTVLGGRVSLETVDGLDAGKAAGVYNHHFLTYDLTKEAYNPVNQCDGDRVDAGKLASARSLLPDFLGAGGDDMVNVTWTSMDGSVKSGYHLQKDNTLLVVTELVNYSNKSSDIFIVYEVETIPGLQGWDAAATLVSVKGCTLKTLSISKTERTVTTSKSFSILVDGAILNSKAHMHKGGEYMLLKINDKVICNSKVNYNGSTIVDVDKCELNYPVKRGDAMSIESVYDLTKHTARTGSDGSHMAHDTMGGDDFMALWSMNFAIDRNRTG